MVRSPLGSLCLRRRQVSGSSAAQMMVCRRGPEIHEAPRLPSLRPAAPRTNSPDDEQELHVPSRRVPNLEVLKREVNDIRLSRQTNSLLRGFRNCLPVRGFCVDPNL